MKRVRYTKFEGESISSASMENLLNALSDYLLDSGFRDPLSQFQGLDHSMADLAEAIERVLEAGELGEDELQEKFERLREEDRAEELVEQLIEQMQQSGMIAAAPEDGLAETTGTATQEGGESRAEFEVTDEGLDYLGYQSLRYLLGAMGRASLGRHSTHHAATGVEASGGSRPYEFGDVLHMDSTATLTSAIAREGLTMPLNVEYRDLHVMECDEESSCATVVMLDCSHSMILYGEDRFTPAKRVAMALSQLIRTQFPGDSLSLVLFHDSAEEIPVAQLARVRVGPYYTNTCEGLRVAQRILSRKRKDKKQIIMITDGKPSALTLPDGSIYKNSFGLDPLVIDKTLEEVVRCKRQNIALNTFMLASDFGLTRFVEKITALCQGKAYFTTPDQLGKYLLLDFMERRARTIS